MAVEGKVQKALIALLKLGLPAGIFAYLLYQVPSEDYQAFLTQEKNWSYLLAAQMIAVIAVLISFLRWRLLLRAMDIPFTLREALRLGFLGYLLNFVSFGSVGGDIFKAVLAAKHRPNKRPEAVASVLLDRAFGLQGLVILAFFGLLAVPAEQLSTTLLTIRNGAGLLAVLSVIALCLAIFSGSWFEKIIQLLQRTPILGLTLGRMVGAVRGLRSSPEVLAMMAVYSVGVHSLLASCVYLLSAGLYPEHPSFPQHLMIVPPSMAVGTLPLAPGGVGYQEAAMATLFKQLPDVPEGFSAIIVATVYRLVTLLIAGIGLVYYWASHGRELTEEAEQAAAELEQQDTGLPS